MGYRASAQRGTPFSMDTGPDGSRPSGAVLVPVLSGAAGRDRVTTVRRPSEHGGREVHAIVELPEPIRSAGYAERARYKLTWPGGIHLLGAGILIIPGRTLDNPEDARAHAAAVLAAAARMEAARS